MAMKDGIKNYRDMMKKMEMMQGKGALTDAEMNMMRPDNIESIIKGDPNLEKMKIQPLSKEMLMREIGKGATSDAEMNAMQNMAGMGMEMAMTGGGGAMSDAESEMITKILGSSAPSDLKLAMEALMQLGLSETQILDLLSSTDGLASALTPDGRTDANPRTMTEGALGSLPTRQTPTEMRPESFGADRTQSMEMQKEAMGT